MTCNTTVIVRSLSGVIVLGGIVPFCLPGTFFSQVAAFEGARRIGCELPLR